jgi:hypothetical protein
MDIKTSLDNITSILIDPSRNNPVIINNKLAWLTTIIVGVCTLGIAQALSALWRKLRQIEQNDTHDKINRIFSSLFMRNHSNNPTQPAGCPSQLNGASLAALDNLNPIAQTSSSGQPPKDNLTTPSTQPNHHSVQTQNSPSTTPNPNEQTQINTAAVSGVTQNPPNRPKLNATFCFVEHTGTEVDRLKLMITEQLRACGIDLVTDNSHFHNSAPLIQFALCALTSRPLVDLEYNHQRLHDMKWDDGIFILQAAKFQLIDFFSNDTNSAHRNLEQMKNDNPFVYDDIVIAPMANDSSPFNFNCDPVLITKFQELFEKLKNDPCSLRIFIAQLIEDTTHIRYDLKPSTLRLADVYLYSPDESDSE